MFEKRSYWLLGALMTLCLNPTADTQADEPLDLLIQGGKIIDGTGNPAFLGDLAIRGDRIERVGAPVPGAKARRVIEARGLVVAPGFIDMHSHSDMTLFEDGGAPSKIRQGVTTEILGEDTSAGPSKGKRKERTVTHNGKTLNWSTLGGYFEALSCQGIAPNVASYVGLGTLLECVQGESLARPGASEIAAMKELIDEAMGEGALGLSTMLASPRELAVTTDDLVELCGAVKRHGGIYSSHIRNEGTEVFEAVKEAIAIGRRAQIPVDIIHIKIADESIWGRMPEIIGLINEAGRAGVNVQANVYPYTRGNNDLVSIIPPWAHEGGASRLVERLKDRALRDRLKLDIKSGLPGWYNHYRAVGGDWSRMLVSARLSAGNREFEGQTMDRIIAAKSSAREPLPDPLDVLFDFLIEEKGTIGAIYAHHTEKDMNLAMIQPWCSIGSDGYALATEGPLRRGHPHPRSFGTFPRVLGEYVRNRKLLTLEEAIQKMTSQNADKAGLLERGRLRAGLFADVSVFDPESVIDRATYLEPFRYSAGIIHVVVNGQLVLEDGRATSARPGRALGRTR